jgi:preprotein translocase subunit SecG
MGLSSQGALETLYFWAFCATISVLSFFLNDPVGMPEVVPIPTGGGNMAVLVKVLLIIASIGLIAVVLLQKGKSAGLSGAISGGAEHLFGKQKARGLELLLERVTIGLAVAFFILSVVAAYIVKI